MSRRTKPIGLMGCGAVADYGHVPAIQKTPGMVLSALYDPNPEAAQRLCLKYGVAKAYSEPAAFFSSGIEAVSVTSPAPCHKDNVFAAANCGLPVLCEKPLAMDHGEASAMISAVTNAGTSLYTAFCYRFSPCALKIRDLLKEEAIGKVRSLRLIYNWDVHGKYMTDSGGTRVIQKRREDRMLEGGPMVDCGTHQIDLAMLWLGSGIVRVEGHGAWVDDYEAPDHMWLHMDHACGAHIVVEMSYSYYHTVQHKRREFIYELIGSDGVIRYDREAETFQMENTSGSHAFPFHSEKSFSGLYREWERALETGHSDLLTSAADGMLVADIARTATNSVIKKRITAK